MQLPLTTLLVYAGAAIAEIAGCFAFWAWLRNGQSIWWLVPGMASLALFAWRRLAQSSEEKPDACTIGPHCARSAASRRA